MTIPATASIAEGFSGALSDWFGRSKPLVLLGCGMAAPAKRLFPLATGTGAVLTARFLDRIGKGIRGAPRDALLADITPADASGVFIDCHGGAVGTQVTVSRNARACR